MSEIIRVTLKSKTEGKNLVEGEKNASLGDGKCIFPFVYKEKTYTKCVKKGEDYICATRVDPKTKKLRRYAYCEESPKTPSPPKVPLTEAPAKKTKKIIRRVIKTKTIPPEIELQTYGIPEEDRLALKVYELPNRKNFVNFINDTYSPYRVKKGAKLSKSDAFTFFNHQKLVRDYLQHDSPYRGLLLYHGLGVGKTCASIAIAEGFKSNREIVVLLNKSLKQNFKVNLLRCGSYLMRLNQHWEFKSFAGNAPFEEYAKYLGLPSSLLRKNGGAWFVNFKKPPNYDTLSASNKEQLQDQIDEMINKRYKFYHMDGLNKARLEKMLEDHVLDNKILIIDEVHNLSNSLSKDFPGVRGRYLRQLIMEAVNLRCVFLSGTPMINDPYEVAQLFNLLRGNISTFQYTLRPSKAPGTLNYSALEKELKSHPNIDQVFIKSRDNLLTVTQIPYGFINNEAGTGVVRNPVGNRTEDEFRDIVKAFLQEKGYASHSNVQNYSAFPFNRQEFMNLFLNEATSTIRNEELFKARILGMVSYYKTSDKSLLPDKIVHPITMVPMSDYQFMNYAEVRKIEIDRDSKAKKRSKKQGAATAVGPSAVGQIANEDLYKVKSSYRAYSRIHCSFTFPESIPRPYPGKTFEDDLMDPLDTELSLESHEEVLEETLERNESEQAKIDAKLRIKEYEKAKNLALKKLDRQKLDYLEMDDENKLMKYSPKYNIVLNRISETPGTVFVYTEYKTLEGIAVLKIVLKANGYGEFKLKKEGNEYALDISEEDRAKPKFAIWGGSVEMSDLIRKIYNNELDEIPSKLRDEVLELLPLVPVEPSDGNLHGNLIKILMTTKTGAEGIDLHNVRQVHIIEPYWNPVRLQQVIGRAVRLNSHIYLPEDERNVDIYTYIAVAKADQLRSDKTLQNDFNGKTSDEILYEISQRKLNIMNTLLRLIKEASMDCTLNTLDTYDPEDPFTCVNYGPPSRLTREDYSYLPNIHTERTDAEKARRYKQETWKPQYVKIRGKEYAMKPAAKQGDSSLLFNADKVKSGVPGDPVGKVQIIEGKKVVTLY